MEVKCDAFVQNVKYTIWMHAGNLDNGLTCSMTIMYCPTALVYSNIQGLVLENSLKLMDYLTLSLQWEYAYIYVPYDLRDDIENQLSDER